MGDQDKDTGAVTLSKALENDDWKLKPYTSEGLTVVIELF